MAYLAAAVHGDSRARFFDVLSMNGVAQVAAKYPNTTVIFVDKSQCAKHAPQDNNLFRLLVSRAKPLATDTEWHNCSLSVAKRLIANVLENPQVDIKTFTPSNENKNEGDAPPGREAPSGRGAATGHGYVYAFAHKHDGWIKIGMTSSEDELRWWGRIRDYIKTLGLPSDGWEFVGFIASHHPMELEAKIHRKLMPFRAVLYGRTTELFRCSIDVYIAALDKLHDFIDNALPYNMQCNAAKEAALKKEADAYRLDLARAAFNNAEQDRINGHKRTISILTERVDNARMSLAVCEENVSKYKKKLQWWLSDKKKLKFKSNYNERRIEQLNDEIDQLTADIEVQTRKRDNPKVTFDANYHFFSMLSNVQLCAIKQFNSKRSIGSVAEDVLALNYKKRWCEALKRLN